MGVIGGRGRSGMSYEGGKLGNLKGWGMRRDLPVKEKSNA